MGTQPPSTDTGCRRVSARGRARRVMVVAPSFPPARGGVERLLDGICRELDSAGFTLTVLAPRRRAAPAWDAGRPWEARRVPRLTTPGGALRAMLALTRELRGGVSCLVVGHWCRLGVLLAAVARLLSGTPCAILVHGLDIGSTKSRLALGLLRRWSLRRADLFIANSRHTRRCLLQAGVEPSRAVVINPRIERGRWLELADRAMSARRRWGLGLGPIVLHPGRLVARKNHAGAIRAVSMVTRDVPAVQYVVAGDGEEREGLESLARRLGLLGSSVFFLGEVTDEELAALYRDCELCVMPSLEHTADGDVEGFGIVFLEAGLFGKPVIGGASGGIPDAVVDGQTGFLVPPEDHQALAQRIAELLCDGNRAARLGEAGRRRVEAEFCWGRGPAAYAQAIGSLTGHPQRRPSGVARPVGETQ